MRRIDALLSEYSESHQNQINKRVHWICVPTIFACVAAFFYVLPPIAGINWMWIAAALVLTYYVSLSWRLALGFVLVMAAIVVVLKLVEALVPLPLWQVAALVFVLAWIGQFWGHAVEGKRPSFFKDLQFLLIGPAWVLGFIYRRLGLSY